MRPRSDTPRDLLQSPTYTVNHNVHYPQTSQSPFMPIPHPRIRTESLSSIKSIPANLQPRKKFRTEDQKILDNKRESRERLSNKNVEKSQLRMFDMIYYNPSTNPMKARAAAKDKQSEEMKEERALPPPENQSSASSIPVPQLRLNAEGELVLDEASLVVENEEHRKNRILLANTNVVYYDELSTNYGFYKRQKRTREWPQEETVKFYRCLNTVGTDFSLMLNLFPNRTRRDLKLKFKKEEKNNPQLIDKALLKFNTFDIEELQRELEKEDEERKKEAENSSTEVKELVKRKILKKQEAKSRAQQQIKSKIEKILSDGEEAINTVDGVDYQSTVQGIGENIEAKKEKRPVKRRAQKPNIASISKRKKTSENLIDTNIDSPTAELLPYNESNIKKESRDVKKENFDNIRESTEDDRTASDWENENTKFPQIDMTPPIIDLRLAKIESHCPPVIEESIQMPCSEEESEENRNEIERESNIELPQQCLQSEEPSHLPSVENPCNSLEAEEMLPSTSHDFPSDIAFDEESFLNSLNLELLSIVVREINGESFYDVYEIDPETQLISDKPLNIPQHFKDIVASVIQQDD